LQQYLQPGRRPKNWRDPYPPLRWYKRRCGRRWWRWGSLPGHLHVCVIYIILYTDHVCVIYIILYVDRQINRQTDRWIDR
jgi:hypothetical protein